MGLNFWQGKRVLVTGHTGFKGAWLSLWLLSLGAEIWGFSLEPNTMPSLFEQLGLKGLLTHQVGDIRDAALVQQWMKQGQPDVVFHLAAQPLVRRSYEEPVETWQTNVLGTVHVLEALKQLNNACAAVLITTDKCYENREWVYGYRESDPLGGYDPYSSSKAAAEIAIASWRSSFFAGAHSAVGIASARAGNVIGGGDWAEDRIVPDAMRALSRQEPIAVRNPRATRPWQHVLEPLSGYLRLAQQLYKALNDQTDALVELSGAFNFGPSLASNRPVGDLVDAILQHWAGSWVDYSDPKAVHEAKLLNLVTDKAFHGLGWQPVWNFERTIAQTVAWYRETHQGGAEDKDAIQALTLAQIQQYQRDAEAVSIQGVRG